MAKTRVTLAYGKTGLDIELPVRSDHGDRAALSPGLCQMRPPRCTRRCASRTPPSRCASACRPARGSPIVVCDVTRATPTSRILPVILSEIDHVDPTRTSPSSSPRAPIGATPRRSLTACSARRSRGAIGWSTMTRSTCAQHRYLGQTSSGGPIWIDADFLDHDFKILTGFIEPHLFAGFSGGPKMVAPGLAAIETVLHLHGAPMIAHPNAIWGITHGNPMHDAIREISAVVKPDFALDVTLNKDHEITSVFAGDLFTAHKLGCAFVKETAMQAGRRSRMRWW